MKNKLAIIFLTEFLSILILLCSCSDLFYSEECKKLHKFAEYIIKDQSLENLNIDAVKYSDGIRYIYFSGVSSMDDVDKIATAVKNNIESNDSYLQEGEKLQILTFEERTGNLITYDDSYVILSNYYNDNIYPTMVYLDMNTVEQTTTEVFAELKNSYKFIEISQFVKIRDVKDITDISSLEWFAVSILDQKKIEYSDYVDYCKAVDEINREKGYMFAKIYIRRRTKDSWEEEYGDDVVSTSVVF